MRFDKGLLFPGEQMKGFRFVQDLEKNFVVDDLGPEISQKTDRAGFDRTQKVFDFPVMSQDVRCDGPAVDQVDFCPVLGITVFPVPDKLPDVV